MQQHGALLELLKSRVGKELNPSRTDGSDFTRVNPPQQEFLARKAAKAVPLDAQGKIKSEPGAALTPKAIEIQRRFAEGISAANEARTPLPLQQERNQTDIRLVDTGESTTKSTVQKRLASVNASKPAAPQLLGKALEEQQLALMTQDEREAYFKKKTQTAIQKKAKIAADEIKREQQTRQDANNKRIRTKFSELRKMNPPFITMTQENLNEFTNGIIKFKDNPDEKTEYDNLFDLLTAEETPNYRVRSQQELDAALIQRINAELARLQKKSSTAEKAMCGSLPNFRYTFDESVNVAGPGSVKPYQSFVRARLADSNFEPIEVLPELSAEEVAEAASAAVVGKLQKQQKATVKTYDDMLEDAVTRFDKTYLKDTLPKVLAMIARKIPMTASIQGPAKELNTFSLREKTFIEKQLERNIDSTIDDFNQYLTDDAVVPRYDIEEKAKTAFPKKLFGILASSHFSGLNRDLIDAFEKHPEIFTIPSPKKPGAPTKIEKSTFEAAELNNAEYARVKQNVLTSAEGGRKSKRIRRKKRTVRKKRRAFQPTPKRAFKSKTRRRIR